MTTADEVYRQQAKQVVDHIQRHPGLRHQDVADAVLRGNTRRLRMLFERGYLDKEALRRSRCVVWVPRYTFEGKWLDPYGWMVTSDLLFRDLNLLWRRRHYRTRARTLAASSALNLGTPSGSATTPLIAGLIRSEAAMMQANDRQFEELAEAASVELLRRIEAIS